jgi:hypothetical protein
MPKNKLVKYKKKVNKINQLNTGLNMIASSS